jgi:hypothetical protein
MTGDGSPPSVRNRVPRKRVNSRTGREPASRAGGHEPALSSPADGAGEVFEETKKTLLAALEQEIRRVDRARLFRDVPLSLQERRQITVFVDGTGVVRTGRLTTLIHRIDRTLPLFVALALRGIDPLSILRAVDRPHEEAEALAVKYFVRLRLELGKKSAALHAAVRQIDRVLIKSVHEHMQVHFYLDQAAKPMRFAHAVLEKVCQAKSDLLSKKQNPLVHRPPVRFARVLMRNGIPRAEAYRVTADFLQAWEPKRFHDWLTPKIVRRRCERAGARRTG